MTIRERIKIVHYEMPPLTRRHDTLDYSEHILKDTLKKHQGQRQRHRFEFKGVELSHILVNVNELN